MAILRPTRYILLISDSDKGARKRAGKKSLVPTNYSADGEKTVIPILVLL